MFSAILDRRNQVTSDTSRQAGETAPLRSLRSMSEMACLRQLAISETLEDNPPKPFMHPHNGAKGILLIFLLCGVADFVWGYVHERSILTGVVWVVLGVFGTAGYLLLFRGQNSGE